MEKIQYGVAHSADFDENTITIEMEQAVCIRAGKFALVRIDTLQEQLELEEFLKK